MAGVDAEKGETEPLPFSPLGTVAAMAIGYAAILIRFRRRKQLRKTRVGPQDTQAAGRANL